MDAAGDRLSFRSRRLPASFSCLAVVVAPGRERAFDEAEWRDAIVLVERGEIGLCGVGGGRRYYSRGAVLCLDGLELRSLHNRGPVPAVLLVVSRRASGCRVLSPIPFQAWRRLMNDQAFNRGGERS